MWVRTSESSRHHTSGRRNASMTKARKKKAKATTKKAKATKKPTRRAAKERASKTVRASSKARAAKPAPTMKPKRNARPAEELIAELRQRLREISDLNAAGALLSWDQSTYMPDGGAVARGRQSAMLG